MRAGSLGMMAMEFPSELFESEHHKGRVDGSLADLAQRAKPRKLRGPRDRFTHARAARERLS
jgi:hypothetical protein